MTNTVRKIEADQREKFSVGTIRKSQDLAVEFDHLNRGIPSLADLYAAAPKLLEALKWIVKRDGECLGDHPKQLQIFKERIAEAEGR